MEHQPYICERLRKLRSTCLLPLSFLVLSFSSLLFPCPQNWMKVSEKSGEFKYDLHKHLLNTHTKMQTKEYAMLFYVHTVVLQILTFGPFLSISVGSGFLVLCHTAFWLLDTVLTPVSSSACLASKLSSHFRDPSSPIFTKLFRHPRLLSCPSLPHLPLLKVSQAWVLSNIQ